MLAVKSFYLFLSKFIDKIEKLKSFGKHIMCLFFENNN